jgi:GTP pyrophosphokinase
MRLYKKAFNFGKKKHKGQKDDMGKDYFKTHCVVVSKLLKLVCPKDENLLCAGLLHDTIEDTNTSYGELYVTFNKDVADLVREVSHFGSKDNTGYYFPNLITTRGIILKFADRLSNLSRMENWDLERQNQYLRKSKFWKSEQ